MDIKTTVESLSKKIPGCVEARMPSTYFRDEIRKMAEARHEVSDTVNKASEEQLYSIAFLYLVKSLDGPDLLSHFDNIELDLIRQIVSLANSCNCSEFVGSQHTGIKTLCIRVGHNLNP